MSHLYPHDLLNMYSKDYLTKEDLYMLIAALFTITR